MNALQLVQNHPYSSSGEWAVPGAEDEDAVSERAQSAGERERERHVTFRLDMLDAQHKEDVRDLRRRVETNHDSQNVARSDLGRRLGQEQEQQADRIRLLEIKVADYDDTKAEVKTLRDRQVRILAVVAALAAASGWAAQYLQGLF